VTWPHDRIPDGDASAPHHAYIGWLVQFVGVGMAWFGFEYVWGTGYSTAGAAITTAGVAVSALGLLVAADDVVEHVTGADTPLEVLWTEYLAPFVNRLDRRR